MSPPNSPLSTLQIDNINLHSPYNPELEAKKIVGRQLTAANPLAVIIIEPGLGYYIPVIKQRNPQCKIIALHMCNNIKNRALWSAEYSWEPQDGEIDRYITHQLWQLAFPIINIIENPAAQRIDRSLYLTIKKVINRELQKLVSNYTTIASFTKQWVINCINNCLRMENKLRSLSHCTADPEAPIIIVGSGPSLDYDMLQAIHRCQPYCNIWCLSSAMTILNYHGIIPNVLITTDGGHWASYHLHDVPKQTAIAMPLTAQIHHSIEYNPVLFFNQQFAVEQAIVNQLYNNKSLYTPTRASVASSALELAQLSSASCIVLVGIDFGFYYGQQTARPHAFTSIREQSASIFNHRESVDFDIFSESHATEGPSTSPALRMVQKHQLYRAELEGVLLRCKSHKKIYQCMSINPLPDAQQITIKQLTHSIGSRINTAFNTQASTATHIDSARFMQYTKQDIVKIIDLAIGTIIHKVESMQSLENSQPLRELCFGLAHQQYLEACNASADLQSGALSVLKQRVISELKHITARYNR